MPSRDIWQYLRHFWLSQPKRAAGIQWVYVRDAAKHFIKHSPTTKNYLAPNVRSAEVELAWPKEDSSKKPYHKNRCWVNI